MRTDPGAEEEIRLIFDKIGRIMLHEAPHLFGDFKVEDGAWVTEYKKV
jgi:thymidylate synthase (FAD)